MWWKWRVVAIDISGEVYEVCGILDVRLCLLCKWFQVEIQKFGYLHCRTATTRYNWSPRSTGFVYFGEKVQVWTCVLFGSESTFDLIIDLHFGDAFGHCFGMFL